MNQSYNHENDCPLLDAIYISLSPLVNQAWMYWRSSEQNKDNVDTLPENIPKD